MKIRMNLKELLQTALWFLRRSFTRRNGAARTSSHSKWQRFYKEYRKRYREARGQSFGPEVLLEDLTAACCERGAVEPEVFCTLFAEYAALRAVAPQELADEAGVALADAIDYSAGKRTPQGQGKPQDILRRLRDRLCQDVVVVEDRPF